MDNLISLFEQMDDREFGYFYKYRLDEFMPKTKKRIEVERNIRQLSIDLINKTIQQNQIDPKKDCPRCYSNLKFEETDIVLVQTGEGGYQKYVHSFKCLVCGYNPFKHKPLNWKIRWNKFLGKYHRNELIRNSN